MRVRRTTYEARFRDSTGREADRWMSHTGYCDRMAAVAVFFVALDREAGDRRWVLEEVHTRDA